MINRQKFFIYESCMKILVGTLDIYKISRMTGLSIDEIFEIMLNYNKFKKKFMDEDATIM